MYIIASYSLLTMKLDVVELMCSGIAMAGVHAPALRGCGSQMEVCLSIFAANTVVVADQILQILNSEHCTVVVSHTVMCSNLHLNSRVRRVKGLCWQFSVR